MTQFVPAGALPDGVDFTGIAMPVEVYIDGEGRLRREIVDIDLAEVAIASGAPASEFADVSVSMSTTVDYYDFGVPIEVKPPPASDTTDITPPGASIKVDPA